MFDLIAKTLFGMEKVLAKELAALGAKQIERGRRLVAFRGDQRLMYRANIWLRTAIRVLRPIHVFTAESEQMLYDGVRQVDWSQHLEPTGSLTIDPVVFNSFCTHSLYAAQLSKDAIVDQFRERGGVRPSVDRDRPDLRINLHLNDNRATIYLDSSGDSLHKRGYRTATNEAPLNEVLAAGILQLAGWQGRGTLVDWMCGSGTLPIEAALVARNIAPGTLRRDFGYMRWKDFDAALHAELLDEARNAYRDDVDCTILGSDLDPRVIAMARQNARQAGVEADIVFEAKTFEDAEPPTPTGWLVSNPPYDERLKLAHGAALYRRIGEGIKRRWSNYTTCLFTGNLEAAEHLGLRASRKTTLFNGPIECRLLRYDPIAPKRPKRLANESVASESTLPQPAPSPAAQVATPQDQSPIEPQPAAARAIDEEHGGESTSYLARDNTARNDADERDDWVESEADAPDEQDAPATLPGERRTWQQQAEVFGNRLTRMAKHWAKWARRQGITCYRLYDRDVPEVPLALDWYEGWLHVAEYDRPHDRTELEHQIWLDHMLDTAAEVLKIERRKVALKRRLRQRGPSQYERQADAGEVLHVREHGHTFEINLFDYLDTGLFLDHRITRAMVEKESQGKRVLNMFAYTAAFTVHAAAGGAASTTTVDLSNTYLDWARTNMRLNGFTQPWHQYIRDDALGFLRYLPNRHWPPFDLAVVDPPTFSNSKRFEDIWEVQRDHVELLTGLAPFMAPGGKIYFSTNFRRFKLDDDALGGTFSIREISRQTVPPDFRNKRIHRCWTLIAGK